MPISRQGTVDLISNALKLADHMPLPHMLSCETNNFLSMTGKGKGKVSSLTETLSTRISEVLRPVVEILADVSKHYSHKLYLRMLSNRNWDRHHQFLRQKATSYEQWAAAGYMLDRTEGGDEWKFDEKSPHYDYELIKERLNILRTIRKNGDIPAMIFNLRTSLSRNLGDMGNARVLCF
jgi:hypothetical protein